MRGGVGYESVLLLWSIAHTDAATDALTKKTGDASASKDDKSAESSAGGSKKDDGIVFEREDVAPLSFHEVSLLDKILKGSTAALGPKPVMMSGAEGSAVLHLTIYLPTRTEMKIDVRCTCSLVTVAGAADALADCRCW